MTLNDPDQVAFQDVEYVGIAICLSRLHGEHQHVGFLYKPDGSDPLLCHLAWHQKLDSEPARSFPSWNSPGSKWFWSQLGLDAINKKYLAAALVQISANKNTVPYGFDAHPPCFDENGVILPQPDGNGLTCATFVVETYRSQGFQLVIETSWPSRPEDERWRDEIIAILENSNPEATEHIEALKRNPTSTRIRPDEVAAATQQEQLPVSYDDCRERAAEICQFLTDNRLEATD